jgi:DNA-binding HxlR family transcriptional regulator
MGVFGRKWALLVFRDVALKVNTRFSDILRANPSITPRVLALRLRELERDGLVRRVKKQDKREVHYKLTPTGRDAIPILTALIYFAAKRRPREVFRDARSRTMMDMFPTSQRALLQGMVAWAARAPPLRSRPAPRRPRIAQAS